MKDLEILRTEIDAIDLELIRLFETRMNVVLDIAAYKLANRQPVFNADREQQVLDKCCALLENKDYSESACQWMQTTMALSRAEQDKYIKARQGS